ncbi:hypothetical protein ABEF95_015295 [Exophiala dermatitidis]
MMSTQHSGGFGPVEFLVTVPHQSLRLMEVPAELVAVIEAERERVDQQRRKGGSKGRGLKSRLQFKSSPNTPHPSTSPSAPDKSSSSSSSAQQGHLHLCSDDKVWAVKQVSTSNSVYITRTQTQTHTQPAPAVLAAASSSTAAPKDVDADADGDATMASATASSNPTASAPVQHYTSQSPQSRHDPAASSDINGTARPGITALSQVRNILELVQITPSDAEIETHIRNIVPVYDDPDREVDNNNNSHFSHSSLASSAGLDSSTATTLQQVLDNIPASTNQILRVLRHLFAFQLPWPLPPSSGESESVGVAKAPNGHDTLTSPAIYLPTTHLLLRAWKTFIQQCVISGINLSTIFGQSQTPHDQQDQNVQKVFKDMLSQADTTQDGILAVTVMRAILRHFNDTQTITNTNTNTNTTSSSLTVSDTDLDPGPEPDPALDLDLEDSSSTCSTWNKKLKLDPAAIRDAVGMWFLLSLKDKLASNPTTTNTTTGGGGGTNSITLNEITKQWAELLPDAWAPDSDDATSLISSIGETYGMELPKTTSGTADDDNNESEQVLKFSSSFSARDGDRLGFAKQVGNRPVPALPVPSAGAKRQQAQSQTKNQDADPAGQKKRKWHEKFAAQRRKPEK